MTGLTLPGMIEEPFWSSGSRISARPARGPEPISARSLPILISETARTFSAPGQLDERVAVGLRLEAVGRRRDLEAAVAGELLADAVGELGVGVDAGAGRGAAERDLPDPAERAADPLGAEPDLGGEAGELLAERDRDGVHQVGAAGLDVVGELVALAVERRDERVDGRQQVARGLLERRQVHGRGEDVVGGLAHVHVVVRVGLVAGEVGDHLVRVHVRGGAGAGLEDVDRELSVVLAATDGVAGGGDPLGVALVEEPELGVGPRGGGLDPPEPVDRPAPESGDRRPGSSRSPCRSLRPRASRLAFVVSSLTSSSPFRAVDLCGGAGQEASCHLESAAPMSRYAPVDPKQSFPALEEAVLERWREGDTFRRQLARAARAAALELLRGPADRERQARLPPRPRPRLQGHLPALQVDVRLRRAAQGRLGLPRPPGRARDREGSSGSARRRRSRPSGSPSSTAAAASRCSPTSTTGTGWSSGSATGSTSTTPTSRWTPTTSSRSGGR